MKKMIAFLIVMALALFFVGVLTTSVTAAEKTACISRGYIIGYGHVGNVISDLPIDENNSIRENLCTNQDGIRFYKAQANSQSEINELVRIATLDATDRHPIAVCSTSGTSANMIDLAYFYYAKIEKINRVEKLHYRAWVTAYAERHSCQIFGPN